MSTEDQVSTLQNRISELELENKRLHEIVEYLTRKLYGKSSEKTSTLSLGQMSLLMKLKFKQILMLRNPI